MKFSVTPSTCKASHQKDGGARGRAPEDEALIAPSAEGEKLKEKLLDPEIAKSYMKLSDVQAEIDANEEKLLELMDEWEKLNEG